MQVEREGVVRLGIVMEAVSPADGFNESRQPHFQQNILQGSDGLASGMCAAWVAVMTLEPGA